MVLVSALSPGERIAKWRAIRGWTYVQLQEKCGIWASKLHRLEHGHQEPKAVEIEQIAKAMGLTVPQFYGAIDDDQVAAG